jgi:hypothetical protein
MMLCCVVFRDVCEYGICMESNYSTAHNTCGESAEMEIVTRI